jgi:hypothetical protein
MRRVGKTTFLRQVQQAQQQALGPERAVYVSFDEIQVVSGWERLAAPIWAMPLETAVLNALMGQGAQVGYVKTDEGFEVDFLARRPGEPERLIQATRVSVQGVRVCSAHEWFLYIPSTLSNEVDMALMEGLLEQAQQPHA